jgi:RNA polymerase-binding transcription factor DksA
MSEGRSPAEVEALAGRLAAERRRTAERIAALTRDFDDIVEAADSANLDDEHDPEGTTVGFERAQVSALLAQARADLAELDRAAELLSAGRYGICEVCSQPIARERLEARPTANRCVACAATRSSARRGRDRPGRG